MPDPQPTPALLLDTDAAKRLRQAELLLDISRKVAAIESPDDVLETLIAITTAEVGAERGTRSEEHTSELQSLMRNSYAVFCLKKNTKTTSTKTNIRVLYE